MKLNYEFLSTLDIFKRIPASDVEKTIQCLSGFTKTFKNDEMVYSPGSDFTAAGILLDGKVIAKQISFDGRVNLMYEYKKGEMFGATRCYLYPEDNNFIVQSQGKSEILFLKLPTGEDMNRSKCEYRMVIIENLLGIMARNTFRLHKKAYILAKATLREKLITYFSYRCQEAGSSSIVLNCTRENIAQYINADRSALSRELSAMQKDGLIKVNGKSIEVLSKTTF